MANPQPSAVARRWPWPLRIVLGTIGLCVLAVVSYGALAWHVASLRPTVRTDPRAELAALVPEVAAGEGAWEAYAAALSISPEAEIDATTGRHAFAVLLEPPSAYWELVGLSSRDPEAPHGRMAPSGLILDEARLEDDRAAERARLAAWWVEQHEPLIAALRVAARRKVLGFEPDFAYDEPAATLLGVPAWGEGVDRNDNSRFAFELLLPHLGLLRQVVRALAVDAVVKASAGDGRTAVDDIEAMVQAGKHAIESRTLISQLVAASMTAQAWSTAARVVRETPEAFDAAQLERLAHVVEHTADPALGLDLEVERLQFADAVQRMFTDNGAGDGVLIPKDAIAGGVASGSSPFPAGALGEGLMWLAGPLIAYGTASRAETLGKFDEYVRASNAEQSKPIWLWTSDPDRIIENLRDDRWMPEYAAILLVAPSFQRAATTVALTALERDGARLEIALARFRLAHGRGARSVSELVPAFLAEIPSDPLSGLPYCESLDSSGMLRVWSAAGDAVEDGGRMTAGASMRSMREPHPVWRVLHGFHAANGRFPTAAELRDACDAARVLMPSGARYEHDAGAPRFVREGDSLETGTDIRIAGPAPAAP